jgi:YfiH family protein
VHGWRVPLPDGRGVEVRATDRSDGDLRVEGDPGALARAREAVADRPWVWLRQVHGRAVLVLGPGDDPTVAAGAEADAVVTTRTDVALAVHGADCGIVALWSPEGVIGAVHAGWKGLGAGVVGAAVAAMRAEGASEVAAIAGPCIGPECYEFGEADLQELVARLGPGAGGRTGAGAPALDLPGALAGALGRAGVDVVVAPGPCTACEATRLWSHRARREQGRQAVVVWLDGDGDGGGRR